MIRTRESRVREEGMPCSTLPPTDAPPATGPPAVREWSGLSADSMRRHSAGRRGGRCVYCRTKESGYGTGTLSTPRCSRPAQAGHHSIGEGAVRHARALCAAPDRERGGTVIQQAAKIGFRMFWEPPRPEAGPVGQFRESASSRPAGGAPVVPREKARGTLTPAQALKDREAMRIKETRSGPRT
jgi:hypothetical protein